MSTAREHHAKRLGRIARGLCATCGKRPPRENLKTCNECAAYLADCRSNRKAKRNEYQRRQKRALVEAGLCWRCKAPVVLGRQLCERHLLIERERQKRIHREYEANFG